MNRGQPSLSLPQWWELMFPLSPLLVHPHQFLLLPSRPLILSTAAGPTAAASPSILYASAAAAHWESRSWRTPSSPLASHATGLKSAWRHAEQDEEASSEDCGAGAQWGSIGRADAALADAAGSMAPARTVPVSYVSALGVSRFQQTPPSGLLLGPCLFLD